jgi:hypothetical protein
MVWNCYFHQAKITNWFNNNNYIPSKIFIATISLKFISILFEIALFQLQVPFFF